jgi:DNA-binding IclR family transcriptional regulator
MAIVAAKHALETLLILAQEREVRVTDVARRLGLSKSTSSRLLATLAGLGFAAPEAKTGRYRLGPAAADVGLAFLRQTDIRETLRPFLAELFRRTNETVLLIVEVNGEAVCIDKVESAHSLRTHAVIGERVPMHCGSAAKALLAFYPPERVEAIIESKGLTRFTANTIGEVAELHRRLAEIRRTGYSVSVEEVNLGAAGVGAPVFNHLGEAVAAISVGGPKVRLTPERLEELAEVIKDVAAQASVHLGYRPSKLRPGEHTWDSREDRASGSTTA